MEEFLGEENFDTLLGGGFDYVVDDLARTTQDPLLAKVRGWLRKDYGFPRESGKKFGVDCIYSSEAPIYPTAEGSVCYEKPEDARLQGLNCAGFGSSVCVTSVFGMLAAAKVLNVLAAAKAATAGVTDQS